MLLSALHPSRGGGGIPYRPTSWQLLQLWGPNWRFILWPKSQLSHASAAGITRRTRMPASPSPWTEFKSETCETGPTVKFSVFKAKLPAVEETPGPAGAPDPEGPPQSGLGASGMVPG